MAPTNLLKPHVDSWQLASAEDDAPADSEPADLEVGTAEADADDPLDAEDEEWPPERRERQLLRLLHDAVAAHIDLGELAPSLELEIALENARRELGST